MNATNNNAAGTTKADLEAEIAKLKQQMAVLKQAPAKAGELSFKVTEKGAVSLYGIGRFPVTLYPEQWEKVLGAKEDLQAFIKKSADEGLFPDEATKAANKEATKKRTEEALAELKKDEGQTQAA